LKKNKKFIYLISPPIIKKNIFFKDLNLVLKTKKISHFQLRLKKKKFKELILIGKKIKKICRKNNVKLIINDQPLAANKIGADGCHLGQDDGSIKKARKILKNKIIGVTCHNSIKLVKKALKEGADYIAIGAFYSTKTKKIKYKASVNLLLKAKKITKKPIVVIGGINSINYKKLLLNKANFLAISGYVWNNKKLNPEEAIKKIK
tara:strand:- start:6409 stop:7023 length:615 start_codon:yes stop_codon:yes gene_type:complete